MMTNVRKSPLQACFGLCLAKAFCDLMTMPRTAKTRPDKELKQVRVRA